MEKSTYSAVRFFGTTSHIAMRKIVVNARVWERFAGMVSMGIVSDILLIF